MGSNSENLCVNTFGIRGFPAKCVCGRDTTIYTSKTQENPGRPFFRCPTHKDDHLFKWVEDAVCEEVEDFLPRILHLESEFCKAKADVEELNAVITELMEEVMRTKTEVKSCNTMMKIGLGIVFLVILVLVLIKALY